MALTQTQLVTAVADRAELSRSDAKRALVALDQVVLEELANAQKVRIGGLVQSTVRVKPARKARKGPQPGDRRRGHDRRQAGQRRPTRPAAGASDGRAALGAEGPPPGA